MHGQGLQDFLRQIDAEPTLADIVAELRSHPDGDQQIVDVAGQNGHAVTLAEWRAHTTGTPGQS